jgi:hypothetical protein
MEEAKRKKIEAKLYQLMAQTDFSGEDETPEKSETQGATIIRRRKGKPDVRVL